MKFCYWNGVTDDVPDQADPDGPWGDFIASQVASGSYASSNEVIEAGLALLAADAGNQAELDALLREGEASGDWQHWDFKSFLDAVHQDDARREAA